MEDHSVVLDNRRRDMVLVPEILKVIGKILPDEALFFADTLDPPPCRELLRGGGPVISSLAPVVEWNDECAVPTRCEANLGDGALLRLDVRGYDFSLGDVFLVEPGDVVDGGLDVDEAPRANELR